MKSFQGKIAVVTGAGSGIGRHLALQLAAAGATVAASDVNQAGLDETLARMPAGASAKGYRVDVSKRDEVFAHADEVKRDFGAAHYVFNNAGVTLAGTIDHSTIEEIEWQLGINLWGVIYGTKAFLPDMLDRGEGHIVNVSSVFGIAAFPCQGAYNVSKFGVRGWTECMWQELEGTGVHATSVHPGGIRTEIAHSARLAQAAGDTERKVMAVADRMLTTPPEECARVILDGVLRNRKRILVGNGARFFAFAQRLAPVSYGRLLLMLQKLS